MAYAVIFAGGTGTRMKSTGLPKQFLEIEGRALIQHTLDPFLQSPRIDGIVIVSLESWIDHMRSLVKDLLGDKVIDVVPGGATGQLSIYAGLDRLRGIAGDDVVLIHDGVRPMIDVDLIDRCIASVEEHGSAITGIPVFETPLESADGKRIDRILDRSQAWIAQAPQAFRHSAIISCHDRALAEGRTDFIDSCSMWREYGNEAYLVQSTRANIKVTTPEDYYTIRGLFEFRRSQLAEGV